MHVSVLATYLICSSLLGSFFRGDSSLLGYLLRLRLRLGLLPAAVNEEQNAISQISAPLYMPPCF